MPHSIAFCSCENGCVCTRMYAHVVTTAHTPTRRASEEQRPLPLAGTPRMHARFVFARIGLLVAKETRSTPPRPNERRSSPSAGAWRGRSGPFFQPVSMIVAFGARDYIERSQHCEGSFPRLRTACFGRTTPVSSLLVLGGHQQGMCTLGGLQALAHAWVKSIPQVQ